jgi:DNA repair exonuclease SbcCD ATPase subunit
MTKQIQQLDRKIQDHVSAPAVGREKWADLQGSVSGMLEEMSALARRVEGLDEKIRLRTGACEELTRQRTRELEQQLHAHEHKAHLASSTSEEVQKRLAAKLRKVTQTVEDHSRRLDIAEETSKRPGTHLEGSLMARLEARLHEVEQRQMVFEEEVRSLPLTPDPNGRSAAATMMRGLMRGGSAEAADDGQDGCQGGGMGDEDIRSLEQQISLLSQRVSTQLDDHSSSLANLRVRTDGQEKRLIAAADRLETFVSPPLEALRAEVMQQREHDRHELENHLEAMSRRLQSLVDASEEAAVESQESFKEIRGGIAVREPEHHPTLRSLVDSSTSHDQAIRRLESLINDPSQNSLVTQEEICGLLMRADSLEQRVDFLEKDIEQQGLSEKVDRTELSRIEATVRELSDPLRRLSSRAASGEAKTAALERRVEHLQAFTSKDQHRGDESTPGASSMEQMQTATSEDIATALMRVDVISGQVAELNARVLEVESSVEGGGLAATESPAKGSAQAFHDEEDLSEQLADLRERFEEFASSRTLESRSNSEDAMSKTFSEKLEQAHSRSAEAAAMSKVFSEKLENLEQRASKTEEAAAMSKASLEKFEETASRSKEASDKVKEAVDRLSSTELTLSELSKFVHANVMDPALSSEITDVLRRMSRTEENTQDLRTRLEELRKNAAHNAALSVEQSRNIAQEIIAPIQDEVTRLRANSWNGAPEKAEPAGSMNDLFEKVAAMSQQHDVHAKRLDLLQDKLHGFDIESIKQLQDDADRSRKSQQDLLDLASKVQALDDCKPSTLEHQDLAEKIANSLIMMEDLKVDVRKFQDKVGPSVELVPTHKENIEKMQRELALCAQKEHVENLQREFALCGNKENVETPRKELAKDDAQIGDLLKRIEQTEEEAARLQSSLQESLVRLDDKIRQGVGEGASKDLTAKLDECVFNLSRSEGRVLNVADQLEKFRVEVEQKGETNEKAQLRLQEDVQRSQTSLKDLAKQVEKAIAMVEASEAANMAVREELMCGGSSRSQIGVEDDGRLEGEVQALAKQVAAELGDLQNHQKELAKAKDSFGGIAEVEGEVMKLSRQVADELKELRTHQEELGKARASTDFGERTEAGNQALPQLEARVEELAREVVSELKALSGHQDELRGTKATLCALSSKVDDHMLRTTQELEALKKSSLQPSGSPETPSKKRVSVRLDPLPLQSSVASRDAAAEAQAEDQELLHDTFQGWSEVGKSKAGQSPRAARSGFGPLGRMGMEGRGKRQEALHSQAIVEEVSEVSESYDNDAFDEADDDSSAG